MEGYLLVPKLWTCYVKTAYLYKPEATLWLT